MTKTVVLEYSRTETVQSQSHRRFKKYRKSDNFSAVKGGLKTNRCQSRILMRFVLLVMLLSGLFFFRTSTPVFFWSKGKIEELSYFKMKSKLHIQLYTLPSTPFFGYSKYSFRFGKRNSQPSGLRSG